MLDNSVDCELRTRCNSQSMLHQFHQGRWVRWLGCCVSPLKNIQTTQPHFYLETSKDQLSLVVLDHPEDDAGHYPEHLERLERARVELIYRIYQRSTGTRQEIVQTAAMRRAHNNVCVLICLR